jgi:hypothetical protein
MKTHSYLIILLIVVLFSCNENKTKQIELNASNASTENVVELLAPFLAFDTTVAVVFKNTKDSINGCQKKNYQFFIANQNNLMPSILKRIFLHYQVSYADYKTGWLLGGVKEDELEEFLPTPTNPENLKKFLTPSSVYIGSKSNCKEGTFNIVFECTWDEEHAVGVMIENGEVVEARLGVDLY